MGKKFFISIIGISLLFLITSDSFAENRKVSIPALVPMPKEYKQKGGLIDIEGMNIYIGKNNRQSEIGANEICLRIKELGGTPGSIGVSDNPTKPGIYILPFGEQGRLISHMLRLHITAEDPGPQGYVIGMNKTHIGIIGSDSIGALYGAMTLRQMIRKNEDGRVVVDNAQVYDKPDYKFRGKMGFLRGLGDWASGEADQIAAYKAGIDWMMRFKMNIIDDFIFSTTDIRQIPEERKSFIREINEYAKERGIYTKLMLFTDVGLKQFDSQDERFKNWDCVQSPIHFFCWSRDELTKEKISQTMKFINDCKFTMLFLHPVDGGGISDPELWSTRCSRCRERFDDRRWEASSYQFNMWAEALKKTCPNVLFTSPIYPYSANHADYSKFSSIKEEIWRKNTIEYWQKTHEHTDPIIIPVSWMSLPHLMDIYRECYKNRPIEVYAHSIQVLGYFGTWHRFNKTNYYGNPNDIFYLAAGQYGPWATWMNSLCSTEYSWNTNAPGSEVYRGVYYDCEKDHTTPREIIEDWLPRACRAFFGEEVGSRIVPVYQAGVLPRYIQNPGEAISIANKYRKTPLADINPMAAPETTGVWDSVPPINDSPERMLAQVKATARAMSALSDAYSYIDTLDRYRRKTFIYFYRRMPIWHMIASARLSVYTAEEMKKAGKVEEAKKILEAGLLEFRKNREYVEKITKQTEKEKDLYFYPPLHPRGDVKPDPEYLEKMLKDASISITLEIKPRPIGDIIKIGILKGFGASATKRFFDGYKNVEAEIIDNLSIATLDRYDCLFVMQTLNITEEGYFTNIPIYVKEGGRGVLFQHNLVGLGNPFGQRTPFPEIVKYGNNKVDIKYVKDGDILEVNMDHPVVQPLKKGDKERHMYYDHITVIPGAEGNILLIDVNGSPVVVAGNAGKGKVVFDGSINLGADETEKDLEGINAIITRGAVEWFTGVKLIKK